MTFHTLVCIISRQPITICVFLGASVTPTCKQPLKISSPLAPRHASSSDIPPRTKVTAASTYRHVASSSLAMSYSPRPFFPLQPPQTPPLPPPTTFSSTTIWFRCLALLLLQVGLPPRRPWFLHPPRMLSSHPRRCAITWIASSDTGRAWSHAPAWTQRGSFPTGLRPPPPPRAVRSSGCPGSSS